MKVLGLDRSFSLGENLEKFGEYSSADVEVSVKKIGFFFF